MKYDKDGNKTPEVETQTIPPREAVGDISKLQEGVDQLLAKFTEQEERLRNMANKLEEHMKERDAHNPGTMGRKK